MLRFILYISVQFIQKILKELVLYKTRIRFVFVVQKGLCARKRLVMVAGLDTWSSVVQTYFFYNKGVALVSFQRLLMFNRCVRAHALQDIKLNASLQWVSHCLFLEMCPSRSKGVKKIKDSVLRDLVTLMMTKL